MKQEITYITLPNGFTRKVIPAACLRDYDLDLEKRGVAAARYLKDPNTMPSKEVS